MQTVAQSELPGILRQVSIRDVCEHGGWFCQAEQRFTILAQGEPKPKCARCGSFRMRLCPPIFN